MSAHSDYEPEMEDLISKQKLSLGRLKKMKTNYGKDGEVRKTKHYMTMKIDSLQEEWDNIRSTQRDIMHQFSSKDNKLDYFKNDVYGEIRELYVEYMAELKQYQEDKYGTQGITTQVTQNNNNVNPRLKLPTISLPNFNGDYQHWTSFHDLFMTLIHNDENMPEVHKLYYLKTHLTEDAESLLRHVTVTDANYQAAWQTLKDRYENKRVLVNAQLTKLLSQKPLQVEHAEGIRSLLDTTSECLKALKNLEIDTKSWDPVIIFLTTQKLPTETHAMWEHSISTTKDLPSFTCLANFLEARFRTMEAVGTLHGTDQEKSTKNKTDRYKLQKERALSTKSFHTTKQNKCVVCNEEHNIRECDTYKKMDVSARFRIAKKNSLCLNCLSTGHIVKDCYSKQNCRTCGKRHHSLLHEDGNNNRSLNVVKDPSEVKGAVALHCNLVTQTILATAIIQVVGPHGVHKLRALLDQGSQVSFITESAVQLLRLPKQKVQALVTGIGQNKERCKSKVALRLTSQKKETIELDALVLKNITKWIPHTKIHRQKWPHLEGLTFADPNFLQPGKIDILLGADVYAEILSEGIKKGPPNTPAAQNTIFGWIISGKTLNKCEQNDFTCKVANFHNRVEFDNIIKRFWEIEEVPTSNILNEEEIKCEQMFRETHSRSRNGRYIVKLPFKQETEKPYLGKSRHVAMARFIQTEKRLLQNTKLKESYFNCIQEYMTLGHMQKTNSKEEQHYKLIDGKAAYACYYLPHHPVLKENSSTTKLRVVFNASQPTESGGSLNDLLMTGPTIQDELKAILCRWRFHKYGYSADIEKMYRQVGVVKNHQDYQRILWRQSPKEIVQEFCLNRLTFGFTSAAFLSIRALQQLAYDEGDNFSLAKNIVLKDFYVDNVLSGADTLMQAKEQREQLINLLDLGGFPLKKWSASHNNILQGLPEDYREGITQKDLSSTEEIKTLGVLWNTNQDNFSYKFVSDPRKEINTKRVAASIIAKVFDPLGWCAPITVIGKILLQSLWLIEADWDQELPTEIIKQFTHYQDALNHINQIRVPRWLGTRSYSKYELHGFCDASNKAYAAVIYIKILEPNGESKINILAASTKVAPIKTISLPRLELCGALLLAKMCKYYLEVMSNKPVATYAWTDSTIVLSWLAGHPTKWKCFVANRVTEIKKMIIGASWRHVPTEDNPADCASRGMNAIKLASHELWWTGPKWLKGKESEWPRNKASETKEETKKIKSFMTQISVLPSFMIKFSKLRTLLRVTAYILRFIHNCRHKNARIHAQWLSSSELKKSRFWLIERNQNMEFGKEIKSLKNRKNISSSSRILKLHPFLDQKGLLRVGGRLQNANIPYEEKHPLILNDKSFLTELIIRHTHLENLHGGPQLTLNSLRQQYWILNARNRVRHLINQCVVCIRQKGICKQQLMGSLPTPRVQTARPFEHTGVDYCGPFNIRLSSGRGIKCQKGYIAIFVCLAVKAIHIEFVSDLTTLAFLAAFRRFVARRGKPTDMYSDCGSNFIGAARVMDRELHNLIKTQETSIAEELSNETINWHFNPPSSPNFGGLWEAGVKSTKYHLKRLLTNKTLTFEEMSTVLAQIEACLNSRPISPLTNDIEDFTALTPGHFLIGKPLKGIPEETILTKNENLLNKWQKTQQIIQHFWKRWHQEYLHHLQQRNKWNHIAENIREGDLTLVKETNLPPNTWLLGRIVKTYPGNDSLSRVADVKTKNGMLKRSISKLCPFPRTEK